MQGMFTNYPETYCPVKMWFLKFDINVYTRKHVSGLICDILLNFYNVSFYHTVYRDKTFELTHLHLSLER